MAFEGNSAMPTSTSAAPMQEMTLLYPWKEVKPLSINYTKPNIQTCDFVVSGVSIPAAAGSSESRSRTANGSTTTAMPNTRRRWARFVSNHRQTLTSIFAPSADGYFASLVAWSLFRVVPAVSFSTMVGGSKSWRHRDSTTL
jgi:hypothetical protein